MVALSGLLVMRIRVLGLVEIRLTLMRLRVVAVPTRVMVTGLMQTLTVTLSMAGTTLMLLTVPSMMALAVMVTRTLSLVAVGLTMMVVLSLVTRRMVMVLGRALVMARSGS